MADLNLLKLVSDPQAMATIPMQPQVQGIDVLPETEAEIKKLIRQKFLESQQLQQQEIEQAKQRLALEQAKQSEAGVLGNLDLRPFAEAARQYGATTAVVPKEAPESNAAMVEKLRQEVIKNQQGMSQEQVNFLKTMMEDKKNAQAALSQKNYEKRLFDTAKTDYIKPANEYAKTAGQYNFVKSEIATGQPTRINRALSQYARIMGQTGVLTDNDIRMQIPPTALGALDRAWTFVSGNPEAQLPEDIVKDLLNTLDSGHYATKDAYKRKIDTIHSMYMSSPAYASMPGLEGLYKSALKPADAQAGEMPVGLPSAASIKAERERRAKEKQSKPKGK